MDRFKIRVAIDISEAQGIAELNKAIASMQAKLKGIKVKIDTSQARAEMNKLNKTTDNHAESTEKATQKTKDYKKGTDEATKGNKKFGQTLGEKAIKFGIWTTLATVIYGAVNAIKEAIKTVMDLETSMTKFEIVADATEEQLKQVDTQVNRLVGALGALKTEVIDTATEFARAGFNVQDSMILAEQAIIGARVGFTDLDHVSQTLIVTLRAFNLETSQSKNVVNDLFVASKTAAVTFEDLGEGLKRSANSMSIAGASFEETMAIISAGNETVQDAAKVGKYKLPTMLAIA
jgi:hypothetical protein